MEPWEIQRMNEQGLTPDEFFSGLYRASRGPVRASSAQTNALINKSKVNKGFKRPLQNWVWREPPLNPRGFKKPFVDWRTRTFPRSPGKVNKGFKKPFVRHYDPIARNQHLEELENTRLLARENRLERNRRMIRRINMKNSLTNIRRTNALEKHRNKHFAKERQWAYWDRNPHVKTKRDQDIVARARYYYPDAFKWNPSTIARDAKIYRALAMAEKHLKRFEKFSVPQKTAAQLTTEREDRRRRAFHKKGLYDFNPQIDYARHSHYRVIDGFC
nr:hypothetical protein [Crucivirus sp.]